MSTKKHEVAIPWDGQPIPVELWHVDGWHGRICVIYPTDKNPQALLNAYRQGQNAKRDGRECGCSACVEEARRVLEASVNHADEKFEYQEMKRKQGFDEVTATVSDHCEGEVYGGTHTREALELCERRREP